MTRSGTAIALPEVEDRGDRRCFLFYDVAAKERVWRCVAKDTDEVNTDVVQVGNDRIPMDEYGNRIECRGVPDEEECWEEHGIDDPFINGDL